MRTWAALVGLILLPTFALAMSPDWPEGTWRPWYDAAVLNQMVHRLLVGYPDLTVRPEQTATRYEWAGVVSRLVWYFDLSLPEPEYRPPDVPWNHWAADACEVLMGTGIYRGPPGLNYCGDRPLTRAQFAFMLANLCNRVQTGSQTALNLSDQGDLYNQAAAALSKEGILVGYPDGQMHLERNVPRWQISVTIHRLLIWLEKHQAA
jgi:hypothetical protein